LQAIDYLDDGTPICLKVIIDSKTGDAVFDFEGTGAEVRGNLNAPIAVVHSAIIYWLVSAVWIVISLTRQYAYDGQPGYSSECRVSRTSRQ
jgi:N-methylhydantoinase B/oxoprolinase/acetone carboxylase alpha subunit